MWGTLDIRANLNLASHSEGQSAPWTEILSSQPDLWGPISPQTPGENTGKAQKLPDPHCLLCLWEEWTQVHPTDDTAKGWS